MGDAWSRMGEPLGAWLRVQPTLTGAAPAFDAGAAPEDPVTLFREWLRAAAGAGVAEPHAMTLATVDADGIPDARTLILKDVGAEGWAFAGTTSSRKGRQLAVHPAAALTFWWQPVLRAVRVRGPVAEASRADSLADLAARSPAAREDVDPDEWALWRVVPTRVEFWQGSIDRRHLRLVYEREDGRWIHSASR